MKHEAHTEEKKEEHMEDATQREQDNNKGNEDTELIEPLIRVRCLRKNPES